jgi:hypothetical protein
MDGIVLIRPRLSKPESRKEIVQAISSLQFRALLLRLPVQPLNGRQCHAALEGAKAQGDNTR